MANRAIFKTLKSVMKLHQFQSMNATRLTCVILIKLLWVLLNWQILALVRRVSGSEISFHKLCQTLTSRSLQLRSETLKNRQKLKDWLLDLIGISLRYNQKEYKKGTENILVKLLSTI
jgi:hypothetical protein